MTLQRNYPAIVSQIVDQCHVGQSNRKVFRYFISRLNHGYATWRTLPREQRHQWLVWVIQCHADNRTLYHSVMG
jgi:hypothetical protein